MIDGWGAFRSFVSSILQMQTLVAGMQYAPCVLLSLISRFLNKVLLCNLSHWFGRNVSWILTFFSLFFSESYSVRPKV
jgi:hypothetical protein